MRLGDCARLKCYLAQTKSGDIKKLKERQAEVST